MQDNVAYNAAPLSNLTSGENVYDIPEVTKAKQKNAESVVSKSKRRRVQVLCFNFLTIIALVLAVVAVALFSFQFASQQQEILMCKKHVESLLLQQQKHVNTTIDAIRFELSGLEDNFSEHLNELIRPSSCGGPGWRRVAFINMTDPNQNCPQGLNLTDYSIRSCGRRHTEQLNCSFVIYPVDDSYYREVCGRVKAFRFGYNLGFLGHHLLNRTLDDAYVDGLSLTHGSPRTHIWSFASGLLSKRLNQNFTNSLDEYGVYCPCDPGNTTDSPSFVGNDYFCESVLSDASSALDISFYPNNVLWDGQNLLDPCYGFNDPPWFYKALPVSTSNDIELRLCLADPDGYEDIAIESLEIYVR